MSLDDAAAELLHALHRRGQGNVEAQNSGTALTLSDPANFSVTVVTLNGVTPVLTLSAPEDGKVKTVVLKQDGSGSRVPSWATPSGAIQWLGGAAPVLPTAAGSQMAVEFICADGVNWIGRSLGKPSNPVTGALSTVADAPAKAVLTSVIAALTKAGIATDGTT